MLPDLRHLPETGESRLTSGNDEFRLVDNRRCPTGDNFLYVFKGARSAPDPGSPPTLACAAQSHADFGRGAARARSPVRAGPGTVTRRAPPAALRPLRATAASARTQSPRPTVWADRRNESALARVLQRVAIPPAPDPEASQDRGQGRASRVAARSLRATLDHESCRGFSGAYRTDGQDRELSPAKRPYVG